MSSRDFQLIFETLIGCSALDWEPLDFLEIFRPKYYHEIIKEYYRRTIVYRHDNDEEDYYGSDYYVESNYDTEFELWMQGEHEHHSSRKRWKKYLLSKGIEKVTDLFDRRLVDINDIDLDYPLFNINNGAKSILRGSGLILKGGKILLVKHGETSSWMLPSSIARCEDKDIDMTVQRAVCRQTGIESIGWIGILNVETRLSSQSRKKENPIEHCNFYIGYRALDTETIRVGEDIRSAAWVPVEIALQLETLKRPISALMDMINLGYSRQVTYRTRYPVNPIIFLGSDL